MALNHSYAFVLRRNAYRDNSLLLDLYTENEGRIAAIARYTKKQSTRIKGMLEPFRLLDARWSGRGDVFTMAQTEEKRRYVLKQKALIQATYINELLLRVLQPQQAMPEIFLLYRQTLQALQHGADSLSLMCFEWALLEVAGYSINLWEDDVQGVAIQSSQSYCFHPERGITVLGDDVADPQDTLISGNLLIALREPELLSLFQQQELRAVLDRLWRILLQGRKLYARPLLGDSV